MPSPFPGMDPYLEAHWGDVHSRIATIGSAILNRTMPAGLRARVETSVAVEVDDPHDDDVVTYYPDIQVEPSGRGVGSGSTTALATEPFVVSRKAEPQTLRSIRIVTADGGDLVTAVEILSPSNKIGDTGRDAFREKQRTLLEGKANVVVIDLIRAGRHVIAVPLLELPRRVRQSYKAVVIRGWKQTQAEVYPISIREKMPTIKVPLRRTDPDALLDLQAILATAYDDGGYDSIDYRRPLDPALSEGDEKWVDKMLKAVKKR
jgi:hypothetical protein